MATKKSKAPPVEKSAAVPPHEHPHEHDLEHLHALPAHSHEYDHPHDLDHEHPDPEAGAVQAIRELVTAFEVGPINSAQQAALHGVRVAIGDIKGSSCAHEHRAFEEFDKLICQKCRADVTGLFPN